MNGSATTPGFHHVAIRAVDFDATVRFYTEGLGFTVHYGFSVPGRALAAGGVSRAAPRTATLGGEPPAEVRIAFITGPNGEVIEFLNSERL